MSHFTREGDKKAVEIKPFKPRALTGDVVNDYATVKEKFGSLASTDPKSNSNFSLHAESKKALGVEREELSHLEDRVNAEVETKFEQLREQAYRDGFEKGREEGKVKAEEAFFGVIQPQFEQFSNLLHHLDQAKHDIYQANEEMLIHMIYYISKQILLRELKIDREYVRRLTAEIIEKVGAKENVRLKVSREDYGNVEQFRDFLKTHFPDLKNVQIDASDDLALGGVQIETDLSRINASVEAQIDSIFNAITGDA